MSDALDKVQDEVQEHGSESRLNMFVAALVAVAATFMALCNVKDGNVVQAMQQAQAKSVDLWSYYQAKGTKQHIAENAAEMLEVQRDIAEHLSADSRKMIDGHIAAYREQAKKLGQEKDEIQAQAKGQEQAYDELNTHDDQFDLAEACLSLSIALFGVTALTRQRWLLFVGLGFCAIGASMGLAGFFHWGLHSDLMARVLG
jgi:hypothetical protein